MTNIEELTKLLFEFEEEMERSQQLITQYWNEKREYEEMMEKAHSAHNEARADYKEAARQYNIIKNQLKELVKDK